MTALTGQDIIPEIDAGAILSVVMVRETAEEMGLKVGSPVLITIRKNAIRMIGQ